MFFRGINFPGWGGPDFPIFRISRPPDPGAPKNGSRQKRCQVNRKNGQKCQKNPFFDVFLPWKPYRYKAYQGLHTAFTHSRGPKNTFLRMAFSAVWRGILTGGAKKPFSGVRKSGVRKWGGSVRRNSEIPGREFRGGERWRWGALRGYPITVSNLYLMLGGRGGGAWEVPRMVLAGVNTPKSGISVICHSKSDYTHGGEVVFGPQRP